MIVGFDISTSLGWALTRLGDDEVLDLVGHGTIDLPTKMNPLDKLERVRALFGEFVDRGGVSGVYVEGVPFVRQAMAHASYWRVRTTVEIVAAEYGSYPVTEVNVATLKRWATGKGNAKKHDMCRAVRERYGVPLYARKDDEQRGTKAQEDEADAILVAAWAHS